MPRSSSTKKIPATATQAKFNLNCVQFVLFCGVLLSLAISTPVHGGVLKKRETTTTTNGTTITSIDPDPIARTSGGDLKLSAPSEVNESENVSSSKSGNGTDTQRRSVEDDNASHLGISNRITVNDELDMMAMSRSNNSISGEQAITPSTTTTTEEILHDLEEVALKMPAPSNENVQENTDTPTISKPLQATEPLRTLQSGRAMFDSEEFGSGDNEAEHEQKVGEEDGDGVIAERDKGKLNTVALDEKENPNVHEEKPEKTPTQSSNELHHHQPNDAHISNEIRSHSNEKRAKFISDNSTNAQQLNLPDGAEVWSLAGMKSVPPMNSSQAHQMERLVLGDSGVSTEPAVSTTTSTTASSVAADLPSTSNSEKNLLDWSQIMLMNSNSLEAKRETVVAAEKLQPFENRTEIVISSTLDSTDSEMEAIDAVTEAVNKPAVKEIFNAGDNENDLPSLKPLIGEILTTTTTTTTTERPILSVTLKQTPAEFSDGMSKEKTLTTTTTNEVILSEYSKDNGTIETTTGAISHITLSANVTEGALENVNEKRDDQIQAAVSHLLSPTTTTPTPTIPTTTTTTAEPHIVSLEPSAIGTLRNETHEAMEPLRENSENEMTTTTTTEASNTNVVNNTSETSELQTREENNETNNEVVESERIPTLSTLEASKVIASTAEPIKESSTEATTSTTPKTVPVSVTPKTQADDEEEPAVERVTTVLTPYQTTTTTTEVSNFDSAATTTTTQATPTSSSSPTKQNTTEIVQIDWRHNIGNEFISSSTTLPDPTTNTTTTTTASDLLITRTEKPEIAETLGATAKTTPLKNDDDVDDELTNVTQIATTTPITTLTTTTIPITTTTIITTTETATPAVELKKFNDTSVTNESESSIETNVIDPVDRERTTLKPLEATVTPTVTPITTTALTIPTTTTTTEATALFGDKANKPERPFKNVTEVEEKAKAAKDTTGNTVEEEEGGEDEDYKNEDEEEHNKNVVKEEISVRTNEKASDKGKEEDEEIQIKAEASSNTTTTTTEVSSTGTTEAATETTTTTTTMAAVLLTNATTTTVETTTSTTTQQPPLISLLDDTTTSTTTTTTITPPPTTPSADRMSTKLEQTYSVFPTTTTSTTTTTTTQPIPIEEEIVTTTHSAPTTTLSSYTTTTTTTTPRPQIVLHASTNTGSGLGMLPTNLPGMNNLDISSSDSGGAASSSAGGGTDVNVIIAVSVGVIGVIAAILLVTFLYLIRKRQKQMSYGQRCRPVSLDAYSLDNVSVLGSVRRKGAMRASKRSYGNVAFDDPSLRHNVLNASELGKFVEKRSQIFEEFRDVPQIIARADEVPAGCEDKNRYANVIPLPETRVTLQQQNDDEKTEYINANYVRGPKDSPNYYIACQAPIEITVADFWRMIWEQKSRVIVQATDLIENGIEKCAEYLPPSVTLDNHTTYGDFQVTLKNREVKDKYAISTIMLKNIVSDMGRELTHYWYKWPEVGVPGEEAPIIAMLLEVRTSLKTYAIEEANELREQNSTLSLKSVDTNDKQNGSTAPSAPPAAMMVASSANGGEINGNVSAEKLKAAAKSQGPLTIHCSPGTGRTGTIIACDMAIRSLETPKRSVDIPQIVYYVRRGRASAVQTREQYEYIYKVANMYATKITNLSNEN